MLQNCKKGMQKKSEFFRRGGLSFRSEVWVSEQAKVGIKKRDKYLDVCHFSPICGFGMVLNELNSPQKLFSIRLAECNGFFVDDNMILSNLINLLEVDYKGAVDAHEMFRM